MRAGQPNRPARSAHARAARRVGGAAEVRRPARLDPRLAGADGYPGLPGWDARSAATVLARYQHLEHIPKLATEWDVSVRGAMQLATVFTEQRERALRERATLRADAPIGADVDARRWTGPRADFAVWAERLGTPALHERAAMLAAARAPVGH